MEEEEEELPVDDFPPTESEHPVGADQWLNATTELTEPQRRKIMSLSDEFPEVFSSKPGRTEVTEHVLEVGNTPPCRQHAYRIP